MMSVNVPHDIRTEAIHAEGHSPATMSAMFHGKNISLLDFPRLSQDERTLRYLRP
jgi:hypothetical protein